MARVRFDGSVITADPVVELANGGFRMRSRQHAPRLSIGTEFEVTKGDVVEMAAAEMPANSPIPQDLTIGHMPQDSIGLAELEFAMAQERLTLQSPAELIKQHQQEIAEGKTLPGRPTQPPVIRGRQSVGPGQ